MRRLLVRALLLSGALAGSSLSQAAPGSPGSSGPEFQVSTFASAHFNYYYHSGPAAALAESGEFLVVWTSSGGEMAGRAFDPAGAPVADEIIFANGAYYYTPYVPEAPDVSASDGQFVAVWTTVRYGPPTSYYDVKGQRFDLLGTPEGSSFTVTTNGGTYAEAASGPGGEFIVAWSNTYVRMRGFTGEAEPSWPMQSIQTISPYRPGPDVAMDALGNFTVIWPEQGTVTANKGIRGRRYSSAGMPLTQTFMVSDYPTGGQAEPAIAALPGGGFVAVWSGSAQNGTLKGIIGRTFDADNQPLTDEFQINTTTAGYFQAPDVSADARGNFMVTWQTGANYYIGDLIRGRRYDRSGTPLGGQFTVSERFPTGQRLPDLSMRGDGESLITWFSTFRDDGYGISAIRARRYCATPNVSPPGDAAVCAGRTASFSVMATGRQPFAYQWVKGGVALQDDGRVAGAMSPDLSISNVHAGDADSYLCRVIDACGEPQEIASFEGQLTIDHTPAEATDLTLQTEDDGATLRFTWVAATGATSYMVRSDAVPTGSFSTAVGAAPDPATGLAIPMTSDTEFFLVAGRNSGCGEGPLR